jgi:hypothetical protein
MPVPFTPFVWRCPHCAGAKIFEVTSGASVGIVVRGFDADGRLVYGEQSVLGMASPERYECVTCGTPLKDGYTAIVTRAHLAQFLRKQNVQSATQEE